jgi:hypothetical protein
VNGTLQMPLNYDSLSPLSPVVRKEVLTGELVRRVKATGSLDDKDVGTLVDSMVSLCLSDVLQFLDDSKKLQEQVQNYKVKLPPPRPPKLPVPELSLRLHLLMLPAKSTQRRPVRPNIHPHLFRSVNHCRHHLEHHLLLAPCHLSVNAIGFMQQSQDRNLHVGQS